MVPLKLLAVFGASILLLEEATATAPTYTYKATLGEEGACLDNINAARAAVGFSELTKPSSSETTKRLPTPSSEALAGEDPWLDVCKALTPKETTVQDSRSIVAKFHDGTYAYKQLTSASPNCKDIVDGWKAAYNNFSEPPPANVNSPEIYKDLDNVSFVAMYNPSSGATADCHVVTCTQTASAAPGAGRATNGEGENLGYALVCMTTPDVLQADNNTAPFSDEQWDQIVTAFTGSASGVFPSLVGLVATALAVGVALL